MKPAVVVAVTGGSGSIYAQRLIVRALEHFERVYLTVSAHAVRVIEEELGIAVDLAHFQPEAFLPEGTDVERVRYYHPRDFDAPFASGSAAPEAMSIVPCSMGTLGRIASGCSDDLITRAADVMLKERRKLILVPRETPLGLIHLRNMVALTEAGAVILPAAPGFYHRPETVLELIDFIVFRILDHLGARDPEARRWGTGDHGGSD
jgi:4-hydroxy-3-polyprenylbenzoate decarboxylase